MTFTDAAVRTMHLAEFDRQVDVLIGKGYPQAAGVTPGVFAKHLMPLKEVVAGLGGGDGTPVQGRLPFVIVATSDSRCRPTRRSGWWSARAVPDSRLDADDHRFRPIEGLAPPTVRPT